MTLEKMMKAGSGAAEQRINRMKANAMAAKDKASPIKKQASLGSDALKQRQLRQKVPWALQASVSKMTRPYK